MSWFRKPTPPAASPVEPSAVANGRPAWMVNGLSATLIEGQDELECVGESHYQDALGSVVGEQSGPVRQQVQALLVPEADNPYDPNAVSAWVNGFKVAHLSREDAAELRPALLTFMRQSGGPIALAGVVVGGQTLSGGRRASLGIWLRYDRATLGLEPSQQSAPRSPSPSSGSVRSGLNNAIATDLDDDAYDLGWQDDLPEDRVQRIPRLRALVEVEQDPISRHYLLAALEDDLYAMRATFPAALEEYDAVALRHDQEMDRIRPALIAKFAGLPLLETYKQSCIRHSKAKDYSAAIWWANRGLQVYGTAALQQAWVDDLQKRVAKLQARQDRRSD